MKNKRGDKIISVYWFAILFIVAAAIVYMAALFYGAPYDVRSIESEILTNHIADCLSQGGYLKESISWDDHFRDNFLEECNLNFAVEDAYDWGEASGSRESGFGGGGASGSFGEEQEQYYVEVGLYEFNQDLEEGIGEEIFNFVEGNVNLKTVFMLERAEEQGGDKEMVVIHYTAGHGAIGAIETMALNGLSVHYLIEKSGNVVSKDNAGDIVSGGEDAFKDENENAAHVGCYDIREDKQRPPCSDVSPECIFAGLLKEECKSYESGFLEDKKCCIPDYNTKSIGIELVNLGHMCGSEEDYCQPKGDDGWTCKSVCEEGDRGIEINGIFWEKFTEAQIDSLVDLVSDVVSRHNIPIDREHIIGHDEITNFKSDPGPAFNWIEFMSRLEYKEKLSPGVGRSFYVIDRNNQQYVIKILAIVGKAEKNVA